jgi:hypothetical protein
LVKCDCGRETIKAKHDVMDGDTSSCGLCHIPYVAVIPDVPVNVSRAIVDRYYASYKSGAKKREFTFEISRYRFECLASSNCVYCGEPPSQSRRLYKGPFKDAKIYLNGIDRKNNDLGYTIDNCVACCRPCNFAKHDMTYKEFCAYLDRVTAYRNKISDRSQVFLATLDNNEAQD